MTLINVGKWILSQSYVEESYNQKQWLDERSFEWSAKDCQGDPLLRELFLLPKKWREQFESQNGAFNNWTVVLVFNNEKRKELFKRYFFWLLVLAANYSALVKNALKNFVSGCCIL